jgi:hypothetical protein
MNNPNRNAYYANLPLHKALLFFILCATIVGIPFMLLLVVCGYFDWE